MDEITENQSSFQLYQYSQFRILQYPLFSDNGYMFPFFFTKRVRISLSRQTAEEKNLYWNLWKERRKLYANCGAIVLCLMFLLKTR